MHAFINNQILQEENGFLHIRDLAIQRGYGIFDFFKIKNGHPFFLNDYLHRFYNSANTMHLKVPLDQQSLTATIYELINKNNLAESGIKMILTGGYSADGYQPADPNLIITQHPLVLPGEKIVTEGVKIITHEYVRDLATAKTINYSMGIWLINKIKEQQAYDVLYHQGGVVSEFPRCNFFIVKQDNTVVTPANNVLQGITRKNIMKLAGAKYTCEENAITLEDIHQAKEAFLTSTTKRIVPIVQINERIIGNGKPGAVSLSLLDDLVALEDADIRAGK